MTDIFTIPIGGTALVTLTGLYDEVGNAYVNNATAAGELLTISGTSVDTFSMAYEAASDGVYYGSITAATTATLSAYTRYIIRVTATTPGGVVYKEDICATAQRSEE